LGKKSSPAAEKGAHTGQKAENPFKKKKKNQVRTRRKKRPCVKQGKSVEEGRKEFREDPKKNLGRKRNKAGRAEIF